MEQKTFKYYDMIMALFVTLALTNYLFKVGVEVLMTPVTYAAVGALKRVEHEDYYDRGMNFNPFRTSQA